MKRTILSYHFWIAILFPVLWLLSYQLQDQYILSFDTTNFFYVVKRWYWEQIKQGHFPLWNDGLYGGIYQVASPAIEIFSPLTAPFFLFGDSFLSQQGLLYLSLILAAAGAYVLGVQITNSKIAALASALIYSLSGPVLSLPDRSPILMAVAFFPWIFFFYLRMSSRPSILNLCGLSLTMALTWIHGEWIAVGAFLAFMILDAFLLLWREKFNFRSQSRFLISLTVVLLLVLSLAAIVWLPTLENASSLDRAFGWSYDKASKFSFHPLRVLSFFSPTLWGQVDNSDFYGQNLANAMFQPRFWFHSIFIGIPTIVLILIGLKNFIREPRWALLFISGVIFFWLSLGKYSALHDFLFSHSSSYAKLRSPEKFIFYSIFCFYLFSILGLKKFIDWNSKKVFFFWILVGIFHVVGLFLLSVVSPDTSGLAALKSAFPEISIPVIEQSIHRAYNCHFWFIGVLAIFFLSLTWPSLRIWMGRHHLKLLIILLASELLVFAPTIWSTSLKALSTSSGIEMPSHNNRLRFLRDLAISTTRENFRASLQTNWGLLEGHRDAFGYETIFPWRSQRLSKHRVISEVLTLSRILNIGYVLSTINPRAPGLKKLFEEKKIEPIQFNPEANLIVLKIQDTPLLGVEFFTSGEILNTDEVLDALSKRALKKEPLFFEREEVFMEGRPFKGDFQIQKSMAEPAKFELLASTFESDSHAYKIQTNQAGYFVSRETFHPLWRVYVDGEESLALRADYLSRAVRVDPGTHLVEWKFQPRGFFIGAWLSGLSLFAVLIGIIVGLNRRKAILP